MLKSPKGLNVTFLVRHVVCLPFIFPLFASTGCSKINSPSPAPGPPFIMPAVGDLTDSSSLLIGDIFPEIEAVDLEGNPIKIDEQSFVERYTLFVFWSTTCGFCMQEMPHEVELAKLYEPLGLRFIGVNSDESTELAKAAIQENGVPWLNLFEGPDQKISEKLGVKVWPTLLLVDSRGMIIAASPLLRAVGAQVHADGSTLPVNGLDWVLKSLFNKK